MIEIPNDDVSPGDIKTQADLPQADLSDVKLQKADLKRANLRRADVCGAEMSTARVNRAKADGHNGEYITESHLSLIGAHVRSSDEPDD